ncbi:MULTISPECIES: HAD-IA family hydrolase [Sphingomonadaceae]|jgi:phosphoglycolate phosphatase|uniref:HAD-IA family hydrolase n=1 Tax=Sphingobium soli TaxID=1591116 RepID=A0ABS8GZQ0_9SPHN|nr:MULTISPECIES: HAD-IA family hydrolase [Sphingomonadaceae]MEE2740715.1 HAD-IA family hydrolase [Pseudomonadota bacterium]MAP44637.1 haloacid dehalogenase [Sphingobium sp.]MBS48542.1 haloacid dehalogenase [Sphingobium sp.]MCC4231561.1 HAD-IA family hydrolase [Sphingobium soli]MCC4256656.1 HAD-IA family hydrolase [Sphingobium lactosutens]|tara:strand:+ start:2342 stop:3001 length:660 start_codon:yes stop_codon:yes gene_type:complete
MTNRLAVFDCDGTLVDSQHNICAAMTRAFEAVQIMPPERLAILAVVGLSLPVAMARLLPEAESDFHDHLAEHYKQAFRSLRQDNAVSEPLYPGIADLVTELDAAGWLLGVATGKSDRGLNLCLTHHGIIDRFVTLQTADRHPSKPHPSMLLTAMAEAGAAPETTVMIGDTSFDIDMGLAAGARAIGVAWGYHPPQELTAAGAHGIAMDSADLRRHIGAP